MYVNNQRDRYVNCFCTGACHSSGICPNATSMRYFNCLDAQHNAPALLYIPPGKVHIHICPTCKNKTEIHSPNITL